MRFFRTGPGIADHPHRATSEVGEPVLVPDAKGLIRCLYELEGLPMDLDVP